MGAMRRPGWVSDVSVGPSIPSASRSQPRPSGHTDMMVALPDEVSELFKGAAEASVMPKVADLMRDAVVSVERDAHIAAVAYLVRRAGETALVVVNDSEHRSPLAVITDTDVAQVIADGLDPNEVRVSDLVAHDPISVSPETSLVRAATVMVSSSIRHLPVVEEGRLLGMLDISDACRALVALRNIPDGAVATAAVG